MLLKTLITATSGTTFFQERKERKGTFIQVSSRSRAGALIGDTVN